MTSEKSANTRRPPIVAVMGHIDHGKSKLLDYIRKSNVVEKAAPLERGEPRPTFIPVEGREAGGITQHIGAYEADVKCEKEHKHDSQKITFLDTPGHEAFTKIRQRGAKVADIAILVIAADEGVKPQTIEAYNSIKEAGIPFVVAFNKIDKPGADPEQVKAQLAENQIYLEGYGGSVPSANISAKTGQGVDELLDLLLLMAEMEELIASKDENASGVVIESTLDPKRGVSATLIIQNGTIRKKMFVVSGEAIAPVRIFEDFQGQPLEEATFSSPIRITGFNKQPRVGAEFKTFETKKEAESYAALNQGKEELAKKTKAVAEERTEEVITVPIIIKADTSGSAEAIEKEIKKLEEPEVVLNIIRSDIGNISEDDIKLASSAKNPIVLGFNVIADSPAKTLAERTGVTIHVADIIYETSKWLKDEIEKRRSIEITERKIGTAEILKIFSRTKNKQLVGGRVIEGKITAAKTYAKIKRDGEEIGEGKMLTLQRKKEEVSEVNESEEFGIMIESRAEISAGDTIEIIEKIS